MEETRAGMKIKEPETRHDRRPRYLASPLDDVFRTAPCARPGRAAVSDFVFVFANRRCLGPELSQPALAAGDKHRQMLDFMASVILMPAPCLRQALTNSRYRGAPVTLPRPLHLRYTGISSTTQMQRRRRRSMAFFQK